MLDWLVSYYFILIVDDFEFGCTDRRKPALTNRLRPTAVVICLTPFENDAEDD